jgi:hypothetical protein
MRPDKTYQSILNHLSSIPVSYLQQVDTYLINLTREISEKRQNRTSILELAGSWDTFSESDFEDFLLATKNVSEEMFNKEIEL